MNELALQQLLGVRDTCPDQHPHLWRIIRRVPNGSSVHLRIECIRSCCGAGLDAPNAPPSMLCRLGVPLPMDVGAEPFRLPGWLAGGLLGFLVGMLL